LFTGGRPDVDVIAEVDAKWIRLKKDLDEVSARLCDAIKYVCGLFFLFFFLLIVSINREKEDRLETVTLIEGGRFDPASLNEVWNSGLNALGSALGHVCSVYRSRQTQLHGIEKKVNEFRKMSIN